MDASYDLDILVQQETNPHAKQGCRINAAGAKKWQLYWDHSVRFQELARAFEMLEVLRVGCKLAEIGITGLCPTQARSLRRTGGVSP